MSSFEERLPATVGAVGLVKKQVAAAERGDDSNNVEYQAQPENYQGSNIHTWRQASYMQQCFSLATIPSQAIDSLPPANNIKPLSAHYNRQLPLTTVTEQRPKTSDHHLHQTTAGYRRTSLFNSLLKSEAQEGSIQNRRVSMHFTTLRALSKRQAKERLKRLVRLVIIVLRWTSSHDHTKQHVEDKGKTYIDMAREVVNSDRTYDFDLSSYRARKEINITSEVKEILSSPPSSRTLSQIEKAKIGLRHVESFAEYPEHMQEMICRVGWFQSVSPGRVIIRQGHLAENFYFILSGQGAGSSTSHTSHSNCCQ